MSDYYFSYVNATSRLTAAKYVIERLIGAVESEDKIDKTVALKLAESELVEIIKVLGSEGDSA